MSDLVFECVEARPERYAAAPTLVLKLRISERTGQVVQAIALRCQIRIQPQGRHYTDEEAGRLHDLFGERSRWGDTLKPLQFTSLSVVIPGFVGATEVEMAVPCTYDFEVSSSKYFHALGDGVVPLLLLFSGTVFLSGDKGFSVEPVPWEKEASYAMPVRVWRELMDQYFPNSAWIRMRRDTLDALQEFKSRMALTSWDDALELLLKQTEEGRP